MGYVSDDRPITEDERVRLEMALEEAVQIDVTSTADQRVVIPYDISIWQMERALCWIKGKTLTPEEIQRYIDNGFRVYRPKAAYQRMLMAESKKKADKGGEEKRERKRSCGASGLLLRWRFWIQHWWDGCHIRDMKKLPVADYHDHLCICGRLWTKTDLENSEHCNIE